MNPRIAFFASDYTADYFRAVCKELEDQCRITVLEYDTMAQLPALLRQAYGEYDGCLLYTSARSAAPAGSSPRR